jgi:hypothetical protein
LARIPEREREHPAQESNHLDPVLLVEMDERLGVAVGAEAVPTCAQLGAQLDIIVNLAIEDDVDRSILVRNRLMAAGQIDNAQPADRETDSGFLEVAFVVRAAMPERAS